MLSFTSRKTSVFVTFLDASKAFDRLNHWLLFDKLIFRGVPKFIVKILVYWYSMQKMCVQWGNSISSCFMVTNGVKQGGILSPKLFTLYMNDLSILLNNCNLGGKIGGQLLNHLIYADDVCLISLSAHAMQEMINICQTFANSHDLLFNSTKTMSMCFVSKDMYRYKPDVKFFLDENQIDITDRCKYLGVIIHDKNTDLDVKKQMRKLYASINTLVRKFGKCSPEVKCKLFDSYCTSLYCSELWFNSSKTVFNKLRVSYNNSLRRLLHLPKYNSASEMFVCLNIMSFNELLRKNIYNFISRLSLSSNPIMIALNSVDIQNQSVIWRWWRSVLY